MQKPVRLSPNPKHGALRVSVDQVVLQLRLVHGKHTSQAAAELVVSVEEGQVDSPADLLAFFEDLAVRERVGSEPCGPVVRHGGGLLLEPVEATKMVA